jgi:hypothetical protein
MIDIKIQAIEGLISYLAMKEKVADSIKKQAYRYLMFNFSYRGISKKIRLLC